MATDIRRGGDGANEDSYLHGRAVDQSRENILLTAAMALRRFIQTAPEFQGGASFSLCENGIITMLAAVADGSEEGTPIEAKINVG